MTRDVTAGNLFIPCTPTGSAVNSPMPIWYLKLVEGYFIFYNENQGDMHPVKMAAHLHQRLVDIHPFIDGNGRTSRLVMNLYLLKHGYPISVIDSGMDTKQECYRILSEYRGVAEGDSKPLNYLLPKK